MTLDVYPVYEVSPYTTCYIPPVTPQFSEGSLPPPGPESLPLGAPASLDGLLAYDITLLDCDTDLLLLAVPLLPLPDDLLLLPVTASEQPSNSAELPSPQEPLPPVASPPQDLSREGPFDAFCAPSDTAW